jgi:hypothetical protein
MVGAKMAEFKQWIASFAGTGLDWCGITVTISFVLLLLLKVTGVVPILSWWGVFAPFAVLGVVIVFFFVWVLVETMRDWL